MQNWLKFLTHDAAVLPRDLHAVLDAQTVALDGELVSYLVREFLDVARIEGVTEALVQPLGEFWDGSDGVYRKSVADFASNSDFVCWRVSHSVDRRLSDYTLSLAWVHKPLQTFTNCLFIVCKRT